MIRSHSNPRVKATLRLRESSSSRRKAGRFLIDGWLELQKAVDARIALETVFYSGESSRSALLGLPLASKILWEVSPEILARLSYGQRRDSIVAVAITPNLGVEQIQLESGTLVLALDRTEKPGNLGACLRTAAASGVGAALLVDPICEVFNPNTIRASRGAVFSLPIAVVTRPDLVAIQKQHGFRLLCARVEAQLGLWECDLRGGCILLFGNEAQGLDAGWGALADADFSIPIKGDPDSLNLSISVAITVYEALRQRLSPNI